MRIGRQIKPDGNQAEETAHSDGLWYASIIEAQFNFVQLAT